MGAPASGLANDSRLASGLPWRPPGSGPADIALHVSLLRLPPPCAGAGLHRPGDEVGAGDGAVSGGGTWLGAPCMRNVERDAVAPAGGATNGPGHRFQCMSACSPLRPPGRHFKSLDQRHLLTVGSEGFWGERDAMRSLNPGVPVSGESCPCCVGVLVELSQR